MRFGCSLGSLCLLFTSLAFIEASAEDAASPWVDPRRYNAGEYNDKTLTEALSAIGTESKTLLIPNGTWKITKSFVVPTHVDLKFESGAILDVSAKTEVVTINGSIETQLKQIFSGAGKVVFGPGSAKTVYPQWWGAAADGTTDDTDAIQKAVDSASENSIVYFTAGRYLFTPKIENRSIRCKSNLTFQGEGVAATIFTCPDSLTDYNPTGQIWFFDNEREQVHDILFTGITFDFNGQNNLRTSSQAPVNNPAIACRSASYNIEVRNCKFINNPGNQCIFVNYDNSVGRNITVSDCFFENMGSGLPGNHNLDHSSIYINAIDMKILDNRFINAQTGNITAIEAHGSVIVTGNIQKMGGNFLILCNDDCDVSGIVSNNVVLNSMGIILWPWPKSNGLQITDVVISNNFVQGRGTGSVVCTKKTGLELKNILISGNIFKSVDQNSVHCGIHFGSSVEGLSIMNNLFDEIGGYGIWMLQESDAKTSVVRDLFISGNSFRDICKKENYNKAINLQKGNFGNVFCTNNVFTGRDIRTCFHVSANKIANIHFTGNIFSKSMKGSMIVARKRIKPIVGGP